MAFQLPNLPYSYNALEPTIDARTMEIHHDKHHAGYTQKLNDAIQGTDMEGKSIEEILRRGAESLPTAVRNNGGGYANHDLFWKIMSPNGGGEPSGELAEAIRNSFGSFQSFKDEFENAASSRFGSGWAWLVLDNSNKPKIYSMPNQDSPLMQGDKPLMGLDVWEHAYYLKYQNNRGAYVKNWWNVVDWNQVNQNFQNAKKG
ncbi:MAG: superoxide dismutase [Caldilineaceae bacterium]